MIEEKSFGIKNPLISIAVAFFSVKGFYMAKDKKKEVF